MFADFIETAGELYTATLASTSGMDLCLDHPFFTADVGGRSDRFIDRKTDFAARYSDPVLGQNSLALILMYFHVVVPAPWKFWYIVYQNTLNAKKRAFYRAFSIISCR
jgi:hypothetical protein